MRQIIYSSISTARSGRADDDLAAILREAIAHNGLDGITGLLYCEDDRFLQVIEGPEESMASLVGRLERDRRHRDMEILIDCTIDTREFGDWAMVYREQRETIDHFDRRMAVLLAGVSPQTERYFRALADA